MKENRLSLIGQCTKQKGGEVCQFICSCGNTATAIRSKVKRNAIRSCGCLRKEFLASGKARLSHGLARTRFWNIFHDIKRRTGNPSRNDYYKYGGRGIKCEWQSFLKFKEDMYESYLKHVSEHGESKTTIDRIDTNGNYKLDNCRWATPKEQANNTRWNKTVTHNGKTRTYTQWEEALSLAQGTVSRRLKAGWPIELVLSNKKYHGQHHIKHSKSNGVLS
jgi:hypothetical protein